MAVDIFVIITGQRQGQFKGQSQDHAFQGKGAMEVLSFSSGFSNPRTIGSAGGGAGAGKPSASEVSMTRAVDVVSTQLQQALLTGELLTSVEFYFRKSGGVGPGPGQQPFMIFALTNAFITAIQMNSESSSEGLVEEIQLVFEQSKLEIQNTDPRTGQVTAGGNTVAYDLTKATVI